MKKLPYKILSTAAIVAALTTGTILPSTHIFAQVQVSQAEQTSESKLGPAAMKEALAETGSHMVAMNVYAKTILEQPDVNLDSVDIGSEGENLVKQIHKDQKVSRNNAESWMDDLKPQMQNAARNIANYHETFEGYYDSLVTYAKENQTIQLQEGLESLKDEIDDNERELSDVIDALSDFKKKLYEDSKQLKIDVDGKNDQPGLAAILAGKDALIPQLQKEIDTLLTSQKDYFNKALTWGIAGGAGTVAAIGIAVAGGITIVVTGGTATPLVIGFEAGLAAAGIGLGVTTSIEVINQMNGYSEAAKSIQKLSEQKDAVGQAVIALANAKETLTDMYTTVDQALSSLTALRTQWKTLGCNYDELIDQVKDMKVKDTSILVDDLNSANKQWNDIYKAADSIAKDMGFN
ncbi:HBL/NHE enterotoxin family protein [Bacillus thuringiensis]